MEHGFWRSTLEVCRTGYRWDDTVQLIPGLSGDGFYYPDDDEGEDFGSEDEVDVAQQVIPKGRPIYLIENVRNREKKSVKQLDVDNVKECPTNLFDRFSGLNSEKAILEFSNKYGWLGIGTSAASSWSSVNPIDAEPLTAWKREINRMRWASKVQETLRSYAENDGAKRGSAAASLGQHFVWLQKKVIHEHPIWDSISLEQAVCFVAGDAGDRERFLREGKVLDAHTDPDSWDRSWYEVISPRNKKQLAGHPYQFWRQYDALEPARYWLAFTVSQKLKGTLTPTIQLGSKGEFRRGYKPSNLLSLVWLQLYEATLGARKFTRCTVCDGLMDVTENTKAKKMHDGKDGTPNCSQAKRNKTRADKVKAVRLSKEGVPPEAISNQLGVDLEEIKRWLAPL